MYYILLQCSDPVGRSILIKKYDLILFKTIKSLYFYKKTFLYNIKGSNGVHYLLFRIYSRPDKCHFTIIKIEAFDFFYI